MRYLDFSAPTSVMRSIHFEVSIGVRSVCGGAEENGSGDSDCAVECWKGGFSK